MLDGDRYQMNEVGFTIQWKEVYWASLNIIHSTEKQRDDIYFGPVHNPAHHHSWLKWTDGQLAELGARLKDDTTCSRPPHTITTGLSTGTMARFIATYDPTSKKVTTTIVDAYSGTEYTSIPVVSTSTGSKRQLPQIQVQVPEGTQRIEGEIAYCRAFEGSDPLTLSTEVAYLPISADGSVGISVQITMRSTG